MGCTEQVAGLRGWAEMLDAVDEWRWWWKGLDSML